MGRGVATTHLCLAILVDSTQIKHGMKDDVLNVLRCVGIVFLIQEMREDKDRSCFIKTIESIRLHAQVSNAL